MAGNDTAALVVALSAQLTKFEKDMDQAYGIADRGSKKIEDRFGKIDPSAGLGEFASKLEGLLTVAGIGAALNQMHQLVAELAKVGEQAERVGLTAKEFQSLQFAAVSTGASVEAAGSFMDRFSRSISEAGRGNGELYKTLLLNNVAIKDAAGNLLPTTVLLGRFADLVKNAKNAQDQMNLAVLAGGRQAGPEFVSLLRQGADGIKAWGEAAERAGVLASDTMIARAKEIEKQYNQLWLRLKLGAQEFAVDVANSGQVTLKKNQEAADDTKKRILGIWDSIIEYINTHSPEGKRVLGNVADFLEEEKHRLVPAPGRISDSAISIGLPRGSDPRTLDAPESDSERSTKLFNVQQEAFKKLLALEDQRIKLLGAEQAAIGLTAGAAEELKTKVNLETAAKRDNIPMTTERIAAIDAEAKKVGAAAQAVDDYKRRWANFNTGLQFVGSNMVDILDGLRTKTLTLASATDQLTNALIKAVEQAALLGTGPFANLFGTQSNVAGGTGGLFGAIGSYFKPDSGPSQASMGGGFGGGIYGNASGTDNWQGGPTWVGEQGRELLNLPRGSQIIPNDVAKGMGGINVAFNVQNNADATVSAGPPKRDSNGDVNIDLVIDRIVAKNALDPGSNSSRALNARGQLARR